MTTRLIRHVACIFLAAIVASCASDPYVKFYQAAPRSPVDPASEPIRSYAGTDPERDQEALLANGYVIVGSSSFNGPAASGDGALKQAQAVGATIVLFYGKYTNSVTGSIPYTVPAPPVTTTTTAQGTVAGSGGVATFAGTATSTTTGTTIYSLPYQIDRYDQTAVYWAHRQPMALGIYFRDLTDSERQALQRNRGVAVAVVVKNTPAFNADILKGDVIVKVDDTDVIDQQQLTALLPQKQSGVVTLSILRNGTPRTITVQLRR